MQLHRLTIILGLAAATIATPTKSSSTLGVVNTETKLTPHTAFQATAGVLGCKVNVNRVSYFPIVPTCMTICMKITAKARSILVLNIGTSGGAWELSWDAWNYLNTGKNATENPTKNDGIPFQWQFVETTECAHLIYTEDGKIPVRAVDLAYYRQCPNGTAQLYNIQSTQCTFGVDERCKEPQSGIDLAICPSQLGINTPLDLEAKDMAMPNTIIPEE